MIAESAILASAAIVLGSLWFADRFLKRESRFFAEKRRILERARQEWARTTQRASGNAPEVRAQATQEVLKLDEQLLALAKEEKEAQAARFLVPVRAWPCKTCSVLIEEGVWCEDCLENVHVLVRKPGGL